MNTDQIAAEAWEEWEEMGKQCEREKGIAIIKSFIEKGYYAGFEKGVGRITVIHNELSAAHGSEPIRYAGAEPQRLESAHASDPHDAFTLAREEENRREAERTWAAQAAQSADTKRLDILEKFQLWNDTLKNRLKPTIREAIDDFDAAMRKDE